MPTGYPNKPTGYATKQQALIRIYVLRHKIHFEDNPLIQSDLRLLLASWEAHAERLSKPRRPRIDPIIFQEAA